LAEEAVARYLLCHDSGGTNWFVKERFEELSAWLGLIGIISAPGRVSTRAAHTAAVRHAEQCALATRAGYRTRIMQELLAIPGRKKPTGRKGPS
jgi:hypothetical protein